MFFTFSNLYTKMEDCGWCSALFADMSESRSILDLQVSRRDLSFDVKKLKSSSGWSYIRLVGLLVNPLSNDFLSSCD